MVVPGPPAAETVLPAPHGVPPPSGFLSVPFGPAADGLLHPGEGPLPYFSPRRLPPPPLPLVQMFSH